jgi:hypothetical protein
MRYLHPVQGHEKFISSGIYKFFKDGQELHKTEEWAIHEHPDGERFIRVDADSRFEDGKSVLLEALQNKDGDIVRFDVNYSNPKFEGGIKTLRATFNIDSDVMQIGYSINGADREYREMELPKFTLIDIPFLIFRGRTTVALARYGDKSVSMFVPLFDFAQLFPGVIQMTESQVEHVIDEEVSIGKLTFDTKRYRYSDKAISYWVDQHQVVIKRVNAHKQHEFVVQISNYAHQN